MDRGGSDKPPGITPHDIKRLSVSQRWWLLWQVLSVLQDQTSPDPWENTSNLPQAATGSSASYSADQPSTSSAPLAPLLNPITCRYRCVFCNSPCIREKSGHRHHRCQAHHNYWAMDDEAASGDVASVSPDECIGSGFDQSAFVAHLAACRFRSRQVDSQPWQKKMKMPDLFSELPLVPIMSSLQKMTGKPSGLAFRLRLHHR